MPFVKVVIYVSTNPLLRISKCDILCVLNADEEAARIAGIYKKNLSKYSSNTQKQIDKKLYQQEFISQMPTNELMDNFLKQNWHKLPEENNIQLKRYFNIEIDNRYSNSDDHSSRVKGHILKMLQLNEIECI